MSESLNILVVGGSRHIGYYAALRFLEAKSTVHFLLRNPSVFDGDAAIQKHVRAGGARLHKGDALNEGETRAVWLEASKERPVDLLLFTVGFTGNPKFHLTKGFRIDPANLVTQCILNLLCTMPKGSHTEPIPTKVIMLSTSGVTRASRTRVPIPLKAMYGYLIAHPLADKFATERIIAYCAGWDSDGSSKAGQTKTKWDGTREGEPSEALTGPKWKERVGLPAPGTLRNAMILRASLLNDGECRADAAGRSAYKVGEGELGGYNISRKDVAYCIFETVTKSWEEYGDKQINVTY
ncbi:hypothetical protein D9619_004639 [Psilocybe cf. subviscida]|uniref:NAD(P)-binding domain-containing protein n=1 Tax=Psilocybe cf. subviscida TaxID=2480587 RepID=A0A8H5BQA3_9AGAR|nr:hypothetical protein D9619_004639 [Psilocybe cf. subviscida]